MLRKNNSLLVGPFKLLEIFSTESLVDMFSNVLESTLQAVGP